MSTNPKDKASSKPDDATHHAIVDEQTGVYGWFRRHQKKLLYSVGLFVLVTFSVSGPMLAAVRDLGETDRPMATILVGGERVSLEPSDYNIGQKIANRLRALSSVVPMISVGDGGRSELGEVYAWLRRAAIAEGFDASFIEVDRAIATMKEQTSVVSETQLARQQGFGSLAEFKGLIAEALRIGTMMQLQTLALDNSDASILEKVIGDREKIAFRVATFDEAGRSEELKAAGGMSDDDLRGWLDGKEEGEKTRLQVFDTNRVALRIPALMHDEFDRAEWEEELTDFVVGDEQRTKMYTQYKERFKNEDDTYKTADDDAVINELNAMLESQKVLQAILAKLKEQQTAWTKEVTDESRTCNEKFRQAQNEKAVADAELKDDPDNEEKKSAAFREEAEFKAAETAKELAQEAADARLATFDFVAAFTELTVGKKGIVQRAFAEKRNAKELEDLEADGLGLGKWDQAQNATYLSRVGDLCWGPVWTEKATILYQISDVDVKPLKPWDDLKPLLEGAYYNEKAKEEADEKKQKFEDALLRLAKEKMAEKVTEIESKRQERIDAAVAKWEADTQAEIAAAEGQLASKRPGTKAEAAWQKKLEELKLHLASKDERLGEITTEIDDAIAEEIGTEAMKHHHEVLDAAAAEAGFTVTEVGPLPRDLQGKPRFDKKYDETTVFLFRGHSEMDEGDATGVVQDLANRRWHAAVCTKVEGLEPVDVERREFEMAREGGFSFAALQAYTAFQQAYTKEALTKRYDLKEPEGVQRMPEPGDGKPEDGKPQDGKPDPNKKPEDGKPDPNKKKD